MTNDKVRENRLRRIAARQGYKLMKSKRRDPRALDYGLFTIIDPYNNSVAAGPGMTVTEVEDYLS